MLSKSQIKLVKSLKHKKYRNNYNLFIVEGLKGILEAKKSNFTIEKIIITEEVYDKYKNQLSKTKIIIASENQINSVSTLKNNFTGLAILKMKSYHLDHINFKDLILAVDSIKDPGNFGSIIRIADWYNIKNIVCSNDTVDVYNPKVVQSSMGSFLRIKTIYTDLSNFLNKSNYDIIGTSVNGDDIRNFSRIDKGIIVLGNESNGISKEVSKYIDKWVSIKKYGNAESLNVAISSAIILDNIRNS